jgi:ATP-dependent RNA circularization protein (DNA/RNA ligase family)
LANFFRFPHTPHLTWLGEDSPREDKALLPSEVTALLAGDVVVDEKLDGANLGLSLSHEGGLLVQNRGQYLSDLHSGQFARLPAWLAQNSEGLRAVLKPNLILFGEWGAARHSLNYTALPDWFLLFDVYDRNVKRFWSSARRNALATSSGLVAVQAVLYGQTTVTALKHLVVTKQSHYRKGPLEGFVIRRESAEWCESRAKLIHPDFTQAIDTHWRKRTIKWNRIINPFEITD